MKWKIAYGYMKKKYKFAKMMLQENSTHTWVTACEHIGEVKLFSYIIATCNKDNLEWTYDKFKEKAIISLYDIGQTSIFNYLKRLCSAKGKDPLLFKIGKGLYRINNKYIDFK